MKLPYALAALLLFPCLPIGAQPAFAGPASPKSTLFLHYRWHKDSLELVESKRIRAAVKPSRLSKEARARRLAEALERPHTPFSYDLIGPDGKRIATRYLDDPGVRYVEYQEKGDATLRRQEERVDSADIFLQVPEAEAKTIRFFRHAPPPKNESGKPLAKTLGPAPLPAKTQIAEFPLE
jgi:hypothetical protein